MKISYKNRHDWRRKGIITAELSQYIAEELDDHDSDDCVKRARKTGQNAGEALGRLVEILVRKKCLGVEDVINIAGTGYSHEGVELTEGENGKE